MIPSYLITFVKDRDCILLEVLVLCKGFVRELGRWRITLTSLYTAASTRTLRRTIKSR